MLDNEMYDRNIRLEQIELINEDISKDCQDKIAALGKYMKKVII